MIANTTSSFDNFNIASLALDQHCESGYGEKEALIFVDPNLQTSKFTYNALCKLSNQYANCLTKIGIQKGDNVSIFLPRIPEQIISFFGILKCGAVAITLFSAFQDQALKDRLLDSQAKVIITNKELLSRVQVIEKDLPFLERIIVVDDTSQPGSKYISGDTLKEYSDDFKVIPTENNDSAFMLYTSGSTGRPKGIVHKHSAILQQHFSAKIVFNLQENDIFWSTADPGWITGVAYTILAPLMNRTPTVLYKGRFDPNHWYKIIQDQKVSVLYTAPTAIRMLMGDENNSYSMYDLSSLRTIASVGEPLNPKAIYWGEKNLHHRILDTWFQTELGAITITNTYNQPIKIGSMGKALPGIEAQILNDNYSPVRPGVKGQLALKPSQDSLMKTIWKDEEKYQSYFENGWYLTGDEAWMDEDGYFWFSGRMDDIINTAGKRIGPFEIESELLKFPGILESAVIGKPEQLRGEVIKAFIVLKAECLPSDELKKEIVQFMKDHLGGHLYPREIEFVESLPKTRSGKIMRRLLKAREQGIDTGDISTLDD